MQTIKAKLVGVAPLMIHNGRLADPTYKWTKAIKEVSSRKKKTEEDFLELKRLEWFGGLYLDEDGDIAVPADVILGVTVSGAKKNKNGVEAKAGIYETRPFYKLEFDGPKDLDKLYEDGRCSDYRLVVVSRARVMRSRPIFRNWSIQVELMIDPDIIDKKLVQQALVAAGERVGIGELRPRYGRFTVEKVS